MVSLGGEDLPLKLPVNKEAPILCLLDSIDGTQHWIRSKNLYCTALTLFTQDQSAKYRLRVSMVQSPDGTIVLAREDNSVAQIDGHPSPLRIGHDTVSEVADAHVCTVCRRPDHYRILAPLLANGSPFSGLYTFGGNPALVDLAFGRFDAVFQPDAAEDGQPIWDWLPGLHIAQRAGCTVLSSDETPFDVVQVAETVIALGDSERSYIAAANHNLAREIAAWLRRGKRT